MQIKKLDFGKINTELAAFARSGDSSINSEYLEISKKNLEEIVSRDSEYVTNKTVEFLPLNRLNSQNEKKEISKAIENVIESGQYTSGPNTLILEDTISSIYGKNYSCVGVASGTAALEISLRAMNIENGDEVILPVNSFAATENAVMSVGAIPVFANIDESFNISPNEIQKLRTKKTKAVIPVCLYGSITNLAEVYLASKKFDLKVVVDAAQCFGIKEITSFADIIALSFNPFKNLGASGKAGAIVFGKDKLLKRKLREISYHGFDPEIKNMKSRDWGYNLKIDNIQSSVVVAKMPFFRINAIKRAYFAQKYIHFLSEIDSDIFDMPLFSNQHTWHLFPLLVKKGLRDKFIDFMKNNGIGTDIFYPILSCNYNTQLADRASKHNNFKKSVELHDLLVNLPIYNHFSLEEQSKVFSAMSDFISMHE